MNTNDAYQRGKRDASKGKAPLFRETKKGIIATSEDDMSDEWDVDARECYLQGYFSENYY